MAADLTVLNSLERTRLRVCEGVIEKHIDQFMAVGRSMGEILSGKLYRETHKTFEAYIRDKWSMEKRHAYRLIDAAKAAENISQKMCPNGTQTQPSLLPILTSERVVRPLTQLSPEQQVQAVEAAIEKAKEEEKPVTAAIVAEVVESMIAPDDAEAPEDDAPDVAASVLMAKNTDLIKPTREQLEKLAEMPEMTQNAIVKAVEGGKTLSAAIKDVGTLRDAKGKAIPATLQPAWTKALKLDEFSRNLSNILRDVKDFVEDKRMGAYFDKLTFDRDIRNCKHALKFAKPYVVCPTCNGDGCNDCRDTGWLPQTSLTRNAPAEGDAA